MVTWGARRDPSDFAPKEPSADARRFGRNFGSAAIAQIIAQVLTLGASIVLARRLDVASYGIFVFGFAFPSWFLLVVSLGLDEVIATEVAADRSKASLYLTLVLSIRIVLSSIALVALWAAVQVILDDPAARVITVLLGASSLVTTCAGTFTSIFRAFEKLEFGAIVTIAERVVTVSVVVSLLFLGYGLYEVSLAFLGGSFVLFALSAAIGRRRFAWFERGVDRPAVVRALRLAAPFASFNAVGTFTYTTGLVLLTVLQGPEQAGVFNAAFTPVFAPFSFLSILSPAPP